MPSAARSSAAMSMRFICIIASKARFARPGSAPPISLMSGRGTICQETPKRSFTQPHCSASGTAESAFVKRSTSAWVSTGIWNESPR